MYTTHFGLRAEPFSISPDPRCLYMSERHRDALAHLLYGVHRPGGFVALTGEVGTGKTTLSRCLLEQLPPEVDVAIILNPRVTALEFLASVCDELQIPRTGEPWSAKLLVDSLYRYLLDAHGRGRRTVLLVDEAQQLPPTVLEQIRLLTNLETSTQKLLQVILIGQPELATLLKQRNLRQLDQRITARFHLVPLRRRDTAAYIRHRLRVAGGDGTLFSPPAIRAVHRLSGGVPRVINILCDRALLAAYARGARRITAAMVRLAARDVRGKSSRPRGWLAFAWRFGLATVGAIALSSAVLTASDRGIALPRVSVPSEVASDTGRTAPLAPMLHLEPRGLDVAGIHPPDAGTGTRVSSRSAIRDAPEGGHPRRRVGFPRHADAGKQDGASPLGDRSRFRTLGDERQEMNFPSLRPGPVPNVAARSALEEILEAIRQER